MSPLGSQRGFLSSKKYQDNTGPAYTYTAAGRLETRTWERGIITTYGYTAAGDLEDITYSDATAKGGSSRAPMQRGSARLPTIPVGSLIPKPIPAAWLTAW